MTACPGGYLCPHRIIAIIEWNAAFVPADGSMNRILFAETVVRLAWLNALFAAIEPEVDVATQLPSTDAVAAYLVDVITNSTQPMVMAARELAVADMLTLAALPAFAPAVSAAVREARRPAAMHWYFAATLEHLGITSERTVPAAAVMECLAIQRHVPATRDVAGSSHNEMLVELGRMAAPITGMPGGLTLQAQIVANFLRISALPLPIIVIPVPDQVYSHMLLLQPAPLEARATSRRSSL